MTLTSIKRKIAVNIATLNPVLRPYSSSEIPLEQSYLRTSGLRSPSIQGSLVVTNRSETMSASLSFLLFICGASMFTFAKSGGCTFGVTVVRFV